MNIADGGAAPPILLSNVEAERLTMLALQAEAEFPEVCSLLLSEIERAETCEPAMLPADTVRMHSIVRFLDEGQDREQTVLLAYPSEADISLGKISILTHVGSGLIGLTKGQAIRWPGRGGKLRTLRVLDARAPQRLVL